MKKIQQIAFAILISAIVSSAALAGDYADLKFIGFSKNGKYLAFEETGEWESSGGEYATTYYIDTVKNSFAAAPTVFSWMDNEPGHARLLAAYKKSILVKLRKFGIVGGNTGRLVVAHLLNDMSYVTPVLREHYFFEDGKNEPIDKLVTDYEGAFIRRETTEIEKVIFNTGISSFNHNTDEFYELTLIPSFIKSGGCTQFYTFEMTLKNNTEHRNHELQILQKDGENPPKSRLCSFGYKIEQVYVYKGKIAVFLNLFSPGFEGPEMNYLAVTGEIK